jgi:hypothetical protein
MRTKLHMLVKLYKVSGSVRLVQQRDIIRSNLPFCTPVLKETLPVAMTRHLWYFVTTLTLGLIVIYYVKKSSL